MISCLYFLSTNRQTSMLVQTRCLASSRVFDEDRTAISHSRSSLMSVCLFRWKFVFLSTLSLIADVDSFCPQERRAFVVRCVYFSIFLLDILLIRVSLMIWAKGRAQKTTSS